MATGRTVRLVVSGVQIYTSEHRVVAEKALGRPLPRSADVHHIDENQFNNTPSNLVICQDHAYHCLLHVRQRVKAAGGNPNTQRICTICKQVKDLALFASGLSPKKRCKECDASRNRQRRAESRRI